MPLTIINKNAKLDIQCSVCGYKTKLSIKEIEQNPSYVCLGCAKTINLNADNFAQDMKDAESKLKKAFKNIKL
jgi:hypothetical protein